jgi:NAD(P)H-flavin reductase
VKLKSGGRASIWIESTLAVGTEVRIQGPFGLFVVKDEPEIVLVATGAGIAPFRSQALSLLQELSDKRPLHLLFGVRRREDFFWMNEFRALAQQYKNFHFHPTLSGDDVSWDGLRGRVQSHLPNIVSRQTASGIYICGAPEMVKDVKDTCINVLGMPKAQVHAEGYI